MIAKMIPAEARYPLAVGIIFTGLAAGVASLHTKEVKSDMAEQYKDTIQFSQVVQTNSSLCGLNLVCK